jgi:hypothetical protein
MFCDGPTIIGADDDANEAVCLHDCLKPRKERPQGVAAVKARLNAEFGNVALNFSSKP